MSINASRKLYDDVFPHVGQRLTSVFVSAISALKSRDSEHLARLVGGSDTCRLLTMGSSAGRCTRR